MSGLIPFLGKIIPKYCFAVYLNLGQFKYPTCIFTFQLHLNAGIHKQSSREYTIIQETGSGARSYVQLTNFIILLRVEPCHTNTWQNLIDKLFHLIDKEYSTALIFRGISSAKSLPCGRKEKSNDTDRHTVSQDGSTYRQRSPSSKILFPHRSCFSAESPYPDDRS